MTNIVNAPQLPERVWDFMLSNTVSGMCFWWEEQVLTTDGKTYWFNPEDGTYYSDRDQKWRKLWSPDREQAVAAYNKWLNLQLEKNLLRCVTG